MIYTLSVLLGFLFSTAVNNTFDDPQINMDSKLKYTTLNDTTTIAYIEKGKGDVTNLMIHGLAGSHKHYIPLINYLSEKSRCIAIDLPGYGASSKKIEFNTNVLKYFTDVIANFITQNKLKKVNLIGHSMGGQIAIIFAAKYPQLLHLLTLIDPAGLETFTQPEKELLIKTLTPSYYVSLTDEQIRKAFALNFTNMPASVNELIDERIAFTKEEGLTHYCKVIVAGLNGMLTHEITETLAKIKAPTLVLFASEDKLIPNKYMHPNLTPETVAKTANKIPNSTLVMIKEAGHMLQYEKPMAVGKEIQNFITLN